MNKQVKIYTNKREYNKARNQALKFYQKTYSWYKNIQEGMERWESLNKLEVKQ